MKKGFTLVELLAVIAIMAIVALISTPIVLDIINDAKINTIKASAEAYVRGLDLVVANKSTNENFEPSSCSIKDGKVKCENENIDYNPSGRKPKTGFIGYSYGESTNYSLCIDDYKVININGDINVTKGNDCGMLEIRIPGIYSDDSTILYTWQQMIDRDFIHVENDIVYSTNFSEHVPNGKILVIPEGIKAIDEGAFASETMPTLANVLLPDSLEYISDSAFYGQKITSVDLPDHLTYMGWNAFANNRLTSITIPGSLEEVFGGFSGNPLTTVVIEEGVKAIYEYAFAGEGDFWQGINNGTITSVTLPDSVEYIGEYAFAFNKITSIDLPDNLQQMNFNAFSGNQITSVTIPGSLEYVNECFYANPLTTVVIEEGVKGLYECAFEAYWDENDNPIGTITSVTLPSTLEFIEYDAFYYQNISSITIPGMEYLYPAFYGNPLTTVTISGDIINAYEAPFGGTQASTVIVSEGVTRIPDYLFSAMLDWETNEYVSTITSASLPSTLTYIGSYAFWGHQLTSLTIPNNVEYIGEYAFGAIYNSDTGASNGRLASLTLGSGLEYIGYNAFLGQRLTSVTIPNSVDTIDECAFGENPLTSVTIGTGTINVYYGAFCSWNYNENSWAQSTITSATFLDPNGWSIDGSPIPSSDLSNPSTAASILGNAACNWGMIKNTNP